MWNKSPIRHVDNVTENVVRYVEYISHQTCWQGNRKCQLHVCGKFYFVRYINQVTKTICQLQRLCGINLSDTGILTRIWSDMWNIWHQIWWLVTKKLCQLQHVCGINLSDILIRLQKILGQICEIYYNVYGDYIFVVTKTLLLDM